ncbi:hypothetical protein F9K33_02625 [bacterium]|nr:MAG: hypothetical protein F9K33_02625 [bacterium]
MLKSTFCFICLISLSLRSLSAQDHGFGLGIIVGDPTGINGKLWMSPNTAFDAAAAWDLGKNGGIQVHGDFLIHKYNLITVQSGKLPVYFGMGGLIGLHDKKAIGMRGPVGLDYLFATAPVDIFIELVPVFVLIPKTDFTFNGAIGVRYFFK